MPAQLQVHVVPVGWEFDRIVLPFTSSGDGWRKLLAHRVHLVVPNAKGARDFDTKAEKALKDEGIEVEVHPVDKTRGDEIVEMEEVMRMTAELCRREAHEGKHHVSINLSAASKMAAFAAGLGGMAYQQTGLIRFYYVHPRSYADEETSPAKRARTFNEHGMSVGVKAIQWIDPMPLNQPPRIEMQVLSFLSRHPSATYLEVVRHLIPLPKGPFGKAYADLLDPGDAKRLGWTQTQRAEEAHRGSTKAIGLQRPLRNKAVTSMKRITANLEDLGLVKHDTRGREGILELTQKGRMYALLARDETSATPKRA